MQQINKYEQAIIENRTIYVDGIEYTGFGLVEAIRRENAKGNFRIYNIATGGIGTHSPFGNLLAKLGIE
jgi:hypothetical protein